MIILSRDDKIFFSFLLILINKLTYSTSQVGKHGPITLAGFHQKLFTSDRACLFAVGGVSHGHLLKAAEAIELGKGAGKKPISTHSYSITNTNKMGKPYSYFDTSSPFFRTWSPSG